MIISVPTKPYTDQKPGTSGLRKKVTVYQQSHYIENFIQSSIDVMQFKEKAIIISGDGRFLMDEALQIALKIAIANGVSSILVGINGIMTSPAVSLLIRTYDLAGGFILTSSHNPGGPKHDFGIKIETPEGPSVDSINTMVYERTTRISSYQIIDRKEKIDVSKVGTQTIEGVRIEVVDTVKEYAEEMRTLFDFDLLSRMLQSGTFSMRFDAMNAASGPYAKHIFEDVLGAPKGSVVNAVPLPDFGGLHPDPNPTYAKHLVDYMARPEDSCDFAAASDGDGDRYMVLGRNFFLSPSDSLAIMTANAYMIPGYAQGLKGVARSMPTSMAVDAVCQKLNLDCYETPTGWKFFSNLLAAGKITLCGEESSGAGSTHLREKDGIWAVLYILSLLAVKDTHLEDMAEFHWKKFGRHYYVRHDFEEVDTEAANKLMDGLRKRITDSVGKSFGSFRLEKADEFTYTDPIDGSVSKNQGLRFFFSGGSRLVFRLSGTGSKGATIRIYIERFDSDYTQDVHEAVKELVKTAYTLSDIEKLTDRKEPTAIA